MNQQAMPSGPALTTSPVCSCSFTPWKCHGEYGDSVARDVLPKAATPTLLLTGKTLQRNGQSGTLGVLPDRPSGLMLTAPCNTFAACSPGSSCRSTKPPPQSA